jgi:hypothetical protein
MSTLAGMRKLVNEIKQRPASLTPWEVGFLQSMEKMVLDKKIPSHKQGRILQKIYRRIYGGF